MKKKIRIVKRGKWWKVIFPEPYQSQSGIAFSFDHARVGVWYALKEARTLN